MFCKVEKRGDKGYTIPQNEILRLRSSFSSSQLNEPKPIFKTKVSQAQNGEDKNNNFPSSNSPFTVKGNNNNKSNSNLLAVCEKIIKTKGTNVNSICTYYKVKSLQELTNEQLKDCITLLNQSEAV